MIVRIGTSGYNYFWNEGKPSQFQWYVNQGFKTVEINATFYSFPFKSWINSWKKAPKDFDFSIKVNRSITHLSRLSEKGVELFNKFRNNLKEIEDKISFWLFQMPPTFIYEEKNLQRILNFFKKVKLENKAVIEFRDPSWWNEKVIKIFEENYLIFCSVDSPELPNDILKINEVTYLRMHGRREWYADIYEEKELDEIVEKIFKLKPKICYIYLNNDHGMLPNSKYLIEKFNLSIK
jgi:uncharacterized protein YecE (DUF72 family)